MQTEKLLLPRWIIPLEGDTEVLENYGLAIENGRIAALIPPAALISQRRTGSPNAFGPLKGS